MHDAAHRVGLAWVGRPCFFDPHLIQDVAGRLALSPDELLLGAADSYGLRASPILRLAHSLALAKRIVAGRARGSVVGVRVSAPDVGSMIGKTRLAKLLTESSLPPERVHLFVDLGVLDTDAPPTDLLLSLPYLGRWQAVTILAGSFPPNLMELEPGIHSLPRLEWRMYRHLLNEWPNSYPVPGYGDFGTQHAEFREPQIPCFPSLSVRYAREDDWLVLRGYSSKNKEGGGSRQFIAHARFLTQHLDYSGESFSAGDQYIRERTLTGATPGNLTKWLAASMNHHMCLTAANLARLATETIEVVAEQDHARVRSVPQLGGFGDSPSPVRP